ncbi:MAG: hypothetical protein AB8G11_06155 [Saprospiraceae bacterium]
MKLCNIFLLIIATFICYFLNSCGTQQVGGNFTYESECLGVALDGSQTIKSWGQGRNYLKAIEQAKKNAVRDVLFKGINKGTNECNPRPLVPEVNAQEKYERYFNSFFSDKGAYTKFVSSKDESLRSKTNSRVATTENGVVVGVVVRVLRDDLKNHLYRQEILK